MSPEALNTALAVRDFLLINVHVPDEGEIPGTDAHVAYTDIPALLALVGDDLRQEVVVYLDGGMNAWETAGYPLTD
jgi:hypothetical protein